MTVVSRADTAPQRTLARVARVCALAVALGLVGCERKKPEPNGIDLWEFGKSTLAQAKTRTRCQAQDDLTWCFGARELGLGKQGAQVQLFFKGHEDTAPLAEIALTVRACQGDELGASLERVLGVPERHAKSGDKKLFWRKPLMFVVADLAASGGCEINFVEPADTKRIAELSN